MLSSLWGAFPTGWRWLWGYKDPHCQGRDKQVRGKKPGEVALVKKCGYPSKSQVGFAWGWSRRGRREWPSHLGLSQGWFIDLSFFFNISIPWPLRPPVTGGNGESRLKLRRGGGIRDYEMVPRCIPDLGIAHVTDCLPYCTLPYCTLRRPLPVACNSSAPASPVATPLICHRGSQSWLQPALFSHGEILLFVHLHFCWLQGSV